MGNHAIVAVSMDGTYAIESDPEFGKNLVAAMCAWPPAKDSRRPSIIIGAAGFYPAARVLSRDHSTGVQLVWSQHGMGEPLHFFEPTVPPEVERHLVEVMKALGYSVRKTKGARP